MASMVAAAVAPSTALVSKVEVGNAATKSARCIATPQFASARVSMSVSKPASSQSRRSMLSLLASTVAAGALVSEANAEALNIKLGGPPALSGGLRKIHSPQPCILNSPLHSFRNCSTSTGNWPSH